MRLLDEKYPRTDPSIPSYVVYFITSNYAITASINETKSHGDKFTKVTFVSMGSDVNKLKQISPNIIIWTNWTTGKPENWKEQFLEACGA